MTTDISINPKRSAMLSIDLQTGIVSIYTKDDANFAPRAGRLLRAARGAGMTVIHVQIGFRPNLPEVGARNPLFAAIKTSTRHQQLFQGPLGAIH
jgi:nicotinamidase-related amidase